MSDVQPTLATHPRFMGMRGRSLDLMVSVIATTGFLLFGYDREYTHAKVDDVILTLWKRVSCLESSLLNRS
jgi:hypothetical protein